MTIRDTKLQLLRLVSASMIKEPSFDGKDTRCQQISEAVSDVAEVSPEFILKLAVYLRKELGIRSTACYLFALAAFEEPCRPYLRPYIHHVVNLPNDLLQVATMARDLPGRDKGDDFLPAALRRALTDRFATFTAFHLAKYNKESTNKKKAKKEREVELSDHESDDDGDDSDDEDTKKKPAFTLKTLVRTLHISTPVENVMCIMGKRYPMTRSEFDESGLPGDFDVLRAGKRMKFPVPQTWETQISAQGNIAEVWQTLLDNRSLPFMAMLRNLRNMLLCGMDASHHKQVISRLKSADQVANSRLFPYRFFSAYEAISFNPDTIYEDVEQERLNVRAGRGRGGADRGRGRGGTDRGRGRGRGGTDRGRGRGGTDRGRGRGGTDRGRGRGRGRGGVVAAPEPVAVKPKYSPAPGNRPTQALLDEYKEALDVAVQLATRMNIKPIYGRTAVIVNVGVAACTKITAQGAKGISSVRLYRDVAVLLGLMFKYACEDCELILFDVDCGYKIIPRLSDDGILSNMNNIIDTDIPVTECKFPFDRFEHWLTYKQWIDAVVVIDVAANEYCELDPHDNAGLTMSFRKIQAYINPACNFVHVDVAGNPSVDVQSVDKKDEIVTRLTGFSDSILNFVGESESAQLKYVERIHDIYDVNVNEITFNLDLKAGDNDGLSTAQTDTTQSNDGENSSDAHTNSSSGPDGTDEESADDYSSTTVSTSDDMESGTDPTDVRVFISSTFLDMRNEREALLKKVFPLVRQRLADRGVSVNITEVDLRWGITKDEATSGTSLSLCLNEVQKCRSLFIGMIGERYGYCPSSYQVTPQHPNRASDFEWLKEYPEGRSVTELELVQGVEFGPTSRHSYIYLRDSRDFVKKLPNDIKAKYASENSDAAEKLAILCERLKNDSKVRDTVHVRKYRPTAIGFNKSATDVDLDLSKFEAQVVHDMYNAILRIAPPPDSKSLSLEARLEQLNAPHNALEAKMRRTFVGREPELDAIAAHISHGKSPIMVVTGEAGTGRSAVVAYAASMLASNSVVCLSHYFGAGGDAADPVIALYRLALTCYLTFSLQAEFDVPVPDMDSLVVNFPLMLSEVSQLARVVVVLDGLEHTTNTDLMLQLLPTLVPSGQRNIKFLVACRSGTLYASALMQRRPTPTTLPLKDISDEATKTAMARAFLGQFGKKLEQSASHGNPMKNLVSKKESGNPTFLSFAMDHLRIHSTFDTLVNDVRKIPNTMAQLVGQMLDECEKLHDKEAVRKVVACVVVASPIGGLPESELPFVIPDITGAALRSILAVLGQGVFHVNKGVVRVRNPTIARVLQNRYIKGASEEKALHTFMAEQLLARNPRSAHSLSCLLFHTVSAGLHAVYTTLTTDLSWIEVFARAGLLTPLVSALGSFSSNPVVRKKVEPFAAFIQANAHILEGHPELTVQCARNQKTKDDVSVAAEKVESPKQGWIRWDNRARHSENACRATQKGSSAAILCSTFTSDGRMRVVAGNDWQARVFSTTQGKQTLQLRHPNAVRSVAIKPGNQLVATACCDGAVRLWSMFDGALLATGKAHNKPVNCVTFNPKGDVLLTASDDTYVRMWDTDITDGNLRSFRFLANHRRPVTCVRVHKEGAVFASACFEGKIHVFENVSSDVKRIETLTAKGMRAIRDLAWIPSLMLTVAAASYDGRVRLFNVTSKELLVVLDGHFGRPVTTVLFSPDAKYMVSADVKGCIKVWRAGVVGSEIGSLSGHANTVQSLNYVDGGKALVSAGHDASLRTWHTKEEVLEGSHAPPHSSRITSITFSNDGEWFVSTSDDGFARVCDTKTNVMKFAMEHIHPETEQRVPVWCSGVDELGTKIYTGTADGHVRVWNSFAGLGGNDGSLICSVKRHNGGVSGLSVQPTAVLSAGWDGEVHASDPADLTHLRTFCFKRGAPEIVGMTSWNLSTSPYVLSMLAHFTPVPSVKDTMSHLTGNQLAACIAQNPNADLAEIAIAVRSNSISIIRDECSVLADIVLEDDFMKSGAPTTASSIQYINEDTIVVACLDNTLRVIQTRGYDRSQWDTVAWFHATAPLTAVGVRVAKSVNTTLLSVGDVLGNVYVLEHIVGSDSLELVEEAAAEAEAVEEEDSPCRESERDSSMGSFDVESVLSSTNSDSYTDGSSSGVASSSPSRPPHIEAMSRYFDPTPKGLGLAERKALVKERHMALVGCLKAFKHDPEARRLVGIYAKQQAQTMGSMMKAGIIN